MVVLVKVLLNCSQKKSIITPYPRKSRLALIPLDERRATWSGEGAEKAFAEIFRLLSPVPSRNLPEPTCCELASPTPKEVDHFLGPQSQWLSYGYNV